MSDAFADAIAARYRRAYRVAWRYLRTPDDVEDAVQDAMVKALTYSNTEVRNIDAWFNSVVYSVCIDTLRRQQHRPECDELDAANDVAERQVDTVALQETIGELRRALKPDQWQALTMQHDGWTLEEIAAERGTVVGSVKGLLHYGRTRARDWARSTL